MLLKAFKQFIADSNSVTSHPLFSKVKDEHLSIIDSRTDDYVNSMRKKMINTLSKMQPQYDSIHGSFYNDYSEVTLYLLLQEKGLDIKPIPRQQYSTADFCISVDGVEYSCENKCLLPMNTDTNIQDYQYRDLEIGIELEEKAKTPGVHFGSPMEFQPHKGNKQKYGYNDNLLVIDNIISKVNQNCKNSQLNEKSVLIIDMTHLLLHNKPTASAFIMLQRDENMVYTAPLWTSCFGKIGTTIFGVNDIPFGNFEGYLEQDGFFISNNAINAIAFRFDYWNDNTMFIGFERWGNDLDRVLALFCNEFNNDRNEYIKASIQ